MPVSYNESLIVGQVHEEALSAQSVLRCEVITDFSRLEALSSHWERLWRSDPHAEICQTFDWARAWWRCYCDKVQLCSFAVFDGDQVVGIVPLVKDSDKLVFLGGTHADYGDILCETGRTSEVFESVLQKLLTLPGWSECVLHNLKAGGQIERLLPALQPKLRRHLQIVPSDPCHTIFLDDNRDVLEALLRKDHTKRRINKLRKAGTLTFRHIVSKAEAQAQLKEFAHQQTRRRALAGKEGPKPELYVFLRNLIDELDLNHEFRFGVLQLNGRSLAWHISFHLNGKLLFYQQTFDVDMWDYSPGEVLMHELLKYVNENVSREFDFTRGNEPFKDRFTTHLQESFSLYVEPSGAMGSLRKGLRSTSIPWLLLGRRFQHLAKRHAETFHRFRSVRLWAGGVVARIRYHQNEHTLVSWCLGQTASRLRSIFPGQNKIDLLPLDFLQRGEPKTSSASHALVRQGTLGDLLDIALEHPEIIVPSELPEYRRRLKRGDRAYVVQQDDGVVLMGWVRSRIDERSSSANQVRPKVPVLLLYECWPLSKEVDRGHYCQLLRCIAGEASENQMRVGIRDPQLQRILPQLFSRDPDTVNP